MDSIRPNPSPGIILTDNYRVVEAFNKALEEDPNMLIADIALILQAKFNDTVLYLTNNDAQFVSMEYQFMLNGAPKLSLEIFETNEFFEVRLLRSAATNAVAEYAKDILPPDIKPPSTTFYIAFGLGSDTEYWSNFNAYTLAAAETFQDFGEAKKITLTFVASLGLHEFSLQTLVSFINPQVFENGYVKVIERFRLKTEDSDDQYPIRPKDRQSEYLKARRNYRRENFNFYKAALDNFIDKCFQVFFNTDNVLLLTPNEKIDNYLGTLTLKHNQRTELGKYLNIQNPERPYRSVQAAYEKYREPSQPKPAPAPSTSATEAPSSPFIPQSGPGLPYNSNENINDHLNFINNAIAFLKEQYKDGFLEGNRRIVLEGIEYAARQGENTADETWTFAVADFFKLFKANLCIVSERGNPNTPNLGMFSSKPEFNQFVNNFADLGITLNSSNFNSESIKNLFDGFINSYSQISGNQDIVLIRENDTEILAALDLDIKKKYGKSFFNPNKPLVIFGLKQLIANYVYGQDYNVVEDILAIDKENTKKAVNKKLNKVFNLYNSQNINESSILENLIAQDDQRRERFNQFLKKKNLPIFKYNYQNSNVISITVNDNKAYFNLLSKSYSILKNYASLKTTLFDDPSLAVATLEETELKKIEGEQVDPTTGESRYLELEEQAPLAEAIKEKYAKLKDEVFATQLLKATPTEQLDIIQSMNPDEVYSDDMVFSFLKVGNNPADFSGAIAGTELTQEEKIQRISEALDTDKIEQKVKTFFSYLKSEYGLIYLVEDGYANDPLKFFMDQMDIMNKATFQLEIETLPYFPISNALYMNTPCLLFAIRPSFIGDTKARNPIDDISGAYNIIGYYHKIDSSRAYSRFKLVTVPGE